MLSIIELLIILFLLGVFFFIVIPLVFVAPSFYEGFKSALDDDEEYQDLKAKLKE